MPAAIISHGHENHRKYLFLHLFKMAKTATCLCVFSLTVTEASDDIPLSID
ncbi:hypothetical protein HS9_04307 [Bacillus velezensis]|nr:hypothetical protein HS9_04307 [Bacillus velezensis]